LWGWRIWWNEWQGKPKYSENTCPDATLSTINPTWPDPGSNPGSQRLTASAMARPKTLLVFLSTLLKISLLFPFVCRNICLYNVTTLLLPGEVSQVTALSDSILQTHSMCHVRMWAVFYKWLTNSHKWYHYFSSFLWCRRKHYIIETFWKWWRFFIHSALKPVPSCWTQHSLNSP
jgi:hypothetical protein